MIMIMILDVNLFIKKWWPIRICSFEKKPDVKIKPIKLARLAVRAKVTKMLIVLDLINRESCWENLLWSNLPITINRFAFAKACIIIWKKQIIGIPIASAININPNCLRVDNATIFLASVSIRAENLATKSVSLPKIPQKNILREEAYPNRIINQIPAVTKVDLWTKELTGVGAAIAAGNHLTKGHWALLVKVKIININTILKDLFDSKSPILEKKIPQKTIKKIESPSRFVSSVSNPPFDLIQFW